MKTFILSLFISFSLVSNLWCMEEPVAVPQEDMVTLNFNDGQQRNVSRTVVNRLENLINLVDRPLLSEGSHNLLSISSSDWDKLINLLVEQGADGNNPSMRSRTGIVNYLKNLVSLEEFFEFLVLVDFFGALCDENKPVLDLFPIVFWHRITIEADAIISLLQTGKYFIPLQIESQLAEAIMVAKRIIDEKFSRECIATWSLNGPTPWKGIVEFDAVEWSLDGRLAIGSRDRVSVLEPNGDMTPIESLGLEGNVSLIAWSMQGDLAIASKNKLVIKKARGDLVEVDTLGMQKISLVVWSSEGELAIVDLNTRKVVIRELDGNIVELEVQKLGKLLSVAWSSNGKLAIVGENGWMVSEGNRSVVPPIFTESSLNSHYLGMYSSYETIRLPYGYGESAWLSDGRLIILHQSGFLIREISGEITRKSWPSYMWHNKIGGGVTLSSDGRFFVNYSRGYCDIYHTPSGNQVDDRHMVGMKFWQKDALQVSWSAYGEPRFAIIGKEEISIGSLNGQEINIHLPNMLRVDPYFSWALNGEFALWKGTNLCIYKRQYSNFSIAQVLLVIKLAKQEEFRYLTDEEYRIYNSLPEEIKGRYPAGLDLLRVYKELNSFQKRLVNQLVLMESPRYLNAPHYKIYRSLPQEIQERYLAEPSMLD